MTKQIKTFEEFKKEFRKLYKNEILITEQKTVRTITRYYTKGVNKGIDKEKQIVESISGSTITVEKLYKKEIEYWITNGDCISCRNKDLQKIYNVIKAIKQCEE